jgi:hypothetical protein
MKKFYALYFLLSFVILNSFGQTTYETVNDLNDYTWDDSNAWLGGLVPPNTIGASDEVYVYCGSMTIDSDVGSIVNNGLIYSSTHLIIDNETVTNNGSFTIEGELTLQNSFVFTNNSNVNVDLAVNIANGSLENSGVITFGNTATISNLNMTGNGDYTFSGAVTYNTGTFSGSGNWDFESEASFYGVNFNCSGSVSFILNSSFYSGSVITNSGSITNSRFLYIYYGCSYTIEEGGVHNFTSTTSRMRNYNEITVNGLFNGSNGRLYLNNGSITTVSSTGRVSGQNLTITEYDGSEIIVEADANGSGSLVYNGAGGAISGTYKQFLSNGQWHLLGIPTTSCTLGAFNPPNGDAYMRFYDTPNSNWSAYMFNENDLLDIGTGYQYWTTVDWTAEISGTYNVLASNASLSTQGDKWNLLSNPYPCALDIEILYAQGSLDNIDGSTIYFYSSDSESGHTTNGYQYYNGSNGQGTTNATRYIPPMQGFFVLQSGAGTSFSFPTVAKSHPDREFYKKNNKSGVDDGISDIVKLSLVQKDTLYSEATVLMMEEATNGHDIEFDTRAFFNNYVQAPELYFKVEDELLKINSLGSYPAVVPLVLQFPVEGQAKLSLIEMNDMSDDTEILLEDRESGNYYSIDDTFLGVVFQADSGLMTDRFYLHYNSTVGNQEINDEQINIYSFGNVLYLNSLEVDSELRVFNIMGQLVHEEKLTGEKLHNIELDLPSAYYVIELRSSQESVTRKLYIAK